MSEKYLIYIGKGKGTIPGVPARDLTYEETLLYGPGHLLRSGLYRRAVPEPRLEEPEKPKRTRRRIKETETWQTE